MATRWYASSGLVIPIDSPLMAAGMFESDLMGGAGEGMIRKRTDREGGEKEGNILTPVLEKNELDGSLEPSKRSSVSSYRQAYPEQDRPPHHRQGHKGTGRKCRKTKKPKWKSKGEA